MKKIFYILLVIPVLVLAQSTDQNYVKSTTYKQPTTTSVTNPDVMVATVQIGYFDGLGLPIQQIAHKQSNTGKDIVTHVEYDAFGRQIKEYLPFVNSSASLNYLSSAQSEVLNFYASPSIATTGNANFEATTNPFSEKLLENSPLNRVFKQAAPGDPWAIGNGKEIKFEYLANSSSDNVKLFTANATWNSGLGVFDISVTQNGNYPANQLYKTIVKDENWKPSDIKNNTTEEFKDKQGKIVLKRTYNNNDAHDTYYIFDQYENLTYVLPPLAEGSITSSTIDNLGYQYKYDNFNRLVAKKLPGKQWEYIVYDKLDRPVATGPSLSPYGNGINGWMITQYDVFGRITQTGWKNATVTETTRNTNQTSINSGSNPFILGANDILTKNYYDNYSFAGAPSPMPSLIESQAVATNVKGLPTGSWTKVLDDATSSNAELSYTVYDYKYRPVHTKTTNYLGGYTQVDTHLDWAGKALYTLTKHKRTDADTELVIKDMFEYSPQDKLVLHKQQINSLPEQLISKNAYDELGQLISKNVGGTDITGATSLQNVDYSYNIRGWLKTINDVNSIGTDLFAFKINYNDAETAVNLFNGNISETYWKTSTDNILRMYGYQYDHLNRLLEGNYKRESGNFRDSYLERLTYDKNGNIQSLLRNGDSDANDYEFIIDDLKYTYHPQNKNLLMKVFDTTNSPQGFKDDSDGLNDPEADYKYDENGNVTKDDNKQIKEISYNHLNLPTQILFVNGSKINYLYNASGQKIQKTVMGNESITTNYLSGFQYHNSTLKHFPHAEGYVNSIDDRFKYVYNYTDHLGNIRLSYSDADGNNTVEQNEIIEESHYYPFGLKHTAYNTNERQYIRTEELNNLILVMFPKFAGDGSYNYKYNGKEYQDELGLNAYDLGARLYDPALARFMVQDPMADFINYQSPYVVSDNNPVLYVDEYGLGIFRAIGNLFSRGAFAVKKLFSGKNCNCSQFQGESLADAWSQPDFPALSNLFSGNGRRNNGNNSNSTATEKPFKGDMVTAIGIQPIENATPNFNLPEISIPVHVDNKPEVKKPRVPVFRGNKIPAGTSIELNFRFVASEFKPEGSDSNLKILNDLVKTLKEYPELKIVIEGNMKTFDADSDIFKSNEGEMSVSKFKSERAKAFMKLLQNKGISPSRLGFRKGHSGSMSITVKINY